MSIHLVFVYGSLKSGFHNHRLLDHGGVMALGAATTVKPYFMLSGRAFPFLIDPAALGADHEACVADVIGRVRGELYAIDDETMADLDRLEGHPDFYKRELVPIAVNALRGGINGADIVAWVYFLQDPVETIQRCATIEPDEAGFVEWTQERAEAYMPRSLIWENEEEE